MTVPVLLAHGRSDYTVPHRLCDGIPAMLPNATFPLFEESGLGVNPANDMFEVVGTTGTGVRLLTMSSGSEPLAG